MSKTKISVGGQLCVPMTLDETSTSINGISINGAEFILVDNKEDKTTHFFSVTGTTEKMTASDIRAVAYALNLKANQME